MNLFEFYEKTVEKLKLEMQFESYIDRLIDMKPENKKYAKKIQSRLDQVNKETEDYWVINKWFREVYGYLLTLQDMQEPYPKLECNLWAKKFFTSSDFEDYEERSAIFLEQAGDVYTTKEYAEKVAFEYIAKTKGYDWLFKGRRKYD